MQNLLPYIMGAAVLAIAFAGYLANRILALPAGNEKMVSIAQAIQEGAMAYLNRQYRTIAVIGIALFIVVGLIPALGWMMALGFAVGAILSALAGYVGMYISVRANVRTAEAAKGGMEKAMDVAVKGGAVTGFMVVGLG